MLTQSLTGSALTTLSGEATTLADHADGAVLLVNVASKCGLTPQYTALEKLAEGYTDGRWRAVHLREVPAVRRAHQDNRFLPRTVPDAPEVIRAMRPSGPGSGAETSTPAHVSDTF